MNSIVFASLKNTFDKNPVAREMPLEQFVEYVCDTSKRLTVDPSWTKEEYDAAKIKQKAIAPVGGRRKNADLEDSVIKLDFDHRTSREFRQIKKAFANAPFFNIFHTTASHKHACKNGAYAFRVLVPTRTPFNSNDAWMVQRAICAELGIDEALRDHCTEDGNRVIYLPHKESKITVTEGRVIRAERYIKKAEEMGLRKREAKTLAADEHGLNADIAHFCEAELGLDALSSGRGYEVPCPNEHLHTGKGSTSIMLDGKEVRFVCQHTNNGACTELNRHQHLALRICGLPEELNVDKHPISLSTIKAALPDLPEEEVEELHRTENEESVTCSLEDLEDGEIAELPMPEKGEYIVEGLFEPGKIGDIVAESGHYKSFYVLGVMAASAAGVRFCGADTEVRHHFYIYGEGADTTVSRVKALKATYGDAIDQYIHCRSVDDFDLDKGVSGIVKWIKETCNGEKAGLVAFDTLNATFAMQVKDFSENSSGVDGMGAVNLRLKAIATATNSFAVVVHHTPKGGKKARGSGALYAGVDVELTIERAGDCRINVHNTKHKEGEQPSIGMALELKEFAPAPPPKEYKAAEFDAPKLEGVVEAKYFVPEKHKSLVLMPFGYEPFKVESNSETTAARMDENMDKILDAISCAENPVGVDEIADTIKSQHNGVVPDGLSSSSIKARLNTLVARVVQDSDINLGELSPGDEHVISVPDKDYSLVITLGGKKNNKKLYAIRQRN